MRIYLKEPQTVTETTKAGVEQKRSYPQAGFYNAPDLRAQAWIEEGVAFEATDDNKVNAFAPGSTVAELVDLDVPGETLEDMFSTPQVAPPEPEEDAGELIEIVEAVEEIEATADDEEGL